MTNLLANSSFENGHHDVEMGQEPDGGVYVNVGDPVQRGDKLDCPDNTGISWGDHLHFDVRMNGEYIDPTSLIDWPEEEEPA